VPSDRLLVGVPLGHGGTSVIFVRFTAEGGHRRYEQHVRKQQSLTYTGPITLSDYERLQSVRQMLEKQGFKIPMPSGN
jgi:hypothetical protein